MPTRSPAGGDRRLRSPSCTTPLLHVERARPDDRVAVIADPSLKFALSADEQTRFEADIVGGVLVCTPAGAVDGTHGFLAAVAGRAAEQGWDVLAVSDRAVPGVPLARLRCDDAGRWDVEATGMSVDAERARPPAGRSGPCAAAAPRPERPTGRRRPRIGGGVAPLDPRHVGPEPLELVETAGLLGEDVDDEVAVVEQHPASGRRAPRSAAASDRRPR